MNKPKTTDRIDDLVFLLDGLTRLHHELLAVIDEKVGQMRAGSIEGLQQCARREETLVARIAEQEGLRKQLMDAIGRGFGAASNRARAWTATALAERVADQQRAPLLAAASRLKATLADVARANRTAGLIAREVLKHFRHVFATMAGGASATGYSHSGDAATAWNRALFDAVA